MTKLELATSEMSMQLRYGFNGRENWSHFALGPHREFICARLREMGTGIIRIFFDERFTNPVSDWHRFAAYIQAILNVGDRKSTRLNSSHLVISYAVFC